MDKIDEKWYAEDGSEIKRVLRIVTIILIVAMAAWGVGLWMNERHVPQLPGEVILKGNMSFEEAEGKLLDDGYMPRGEAIKDGADIHRYYESSEAFTGTADRHHRDCTQGAEIRRVRESLDLESAGKNGDRHFLWPGRHGDSEICIYKVNPGKMLNAAEMRSAAFFLNANKERESPSS